MYGYNPYANPAVINELKSDLWIERNVPGGLNSKKKKETFFLTEYVLLCAGPYGQMLDNMMGEIQILLWVNVLDVADTVIDMVINMVAGRFINISHFFLFINFSDKHTRFCIINFL